MKHIKFLLILGSIGVLFSSSTTWAQREIVAIHKFDNKANVRDDAVNTLRNRISSTIINTKKFRVVEREQLATVLQEVKLADGKYTDGKLNREAELKSGQVASAGTVVYGTVLYLGIEDRAGAYGDVALHSSLARVEIELKLTDAVTGEVIASKIVESSSQEQTTGGQADTTRALEKAMQDVAKKATEFLLETRFPYKVTEVASKDIYVSASSDFVKEGDMFDVFRVRIVTDEDTGETRRRERSIGRVRITQANVGESVAAPINGLDIDSIEEGMVIRRVDEARLERERKAEGERNYQKFRSGW